MRFTRADFLLVRQRLQVGVTIALRRRICHASCGSTVVQLQGCKDGIRLDRDAPYDALSFRCAACQTHRYDIVVTYNPHTKSYDRCAGGIEINVVQKSLRGASRPTRVPFDVLNELRVWVYDQYRPIFAPEPM